LRRALAYLQDLCGYWAGRYGWRATEARLNAIPQFTTSIDGVTVHFLHVRSPHPDAIPLIMTHGWPGSFLEFERTLSPLTDPVAHGAAPGDAFHLVVLSLRATVSAAGRPSADGTCTASPAPGPS
jgi:epoxide hydrolase